MKILKPLTALSSAVLAISFPSQSAQAQIVVGDVLVVDIGKVNTVSDTFETPGNWNNLAKTQSTGTPAPLTDLIRFSDGAATGVGFAIADQGPGGNAVGIGGIVVDSAPANFTTPGFAGSGAIPQTAWEDVALFSNDNSTNTFTFSNLDNSLKYNLSWISRIPSGNTRNTLTWSISGGQGSVAINPENNTTIYSFSDLSTDGSGNLFVSIAVGSASGDTAHLNAVELQAVPEPTTIAILLGGIGTLVLLRRFRKA